MNLGTTSFFTHSLGRILWEIVINKYLVMQEIWFLGHIWADNLHNFMWSWYAYCLKKRICFGILCYLVGGSWHASLHLIYIIHKPISLLDFGQFLYTLTWFNEYSFYNPVTVYFYILSLWWGIGITENSWIKRSSLNLDLNFNKSNCLF